MVKRHFNRPFWLQVGHLDYVSKVSELHVLVETFSVNKIPSTTNIQQISSIHTDGKSGNF